MAYLDRADCLLRIKDRLNRPVADTAFTVSATDDVLLRMMTEAQDEITKLIATYIPDAMISAPTALVTADAGKTYTFGTDADAANYFPLGHFMVFATRADIPDFPLEPGVDFVFEGARIRIPANNTRTFADGGPWAQTVNAAVNQITGASEPSIPVITRLGLVEKTAAKAAVRLGLDPSEFDSAFNERWLEVLAAVRTQAMGKYGATLSNRSPAWWMSRRRI